MIWLPSLALSTSTLHTETFHKYFFLQKRFHFMDGFSPNWTSFVSMLNISIFRIWKNSTYLSNSIRNWSEWWFFAFFCAICEFSINIQRCSLCFCLGQPARSKWAVGWNNEGAQWLFGEKTFIFPKVFLPIKWWTFGDFEWDKRPSQSTASCSKVLWGNLSLIWKQ